MILGNSITIKDKDSLNHFIDNVKQALESGKIIKITVEQKSTRTITQNRAMHLYCERVAQEANSRGLTVTEFFKEGFQVMWTKDFVKENMFKSVLKALTGKESTTEATKMEYGDVYDVLNAKLAEHGLHVEWPNRDDL